MMHGKPRHLAVQKGLKSPGDRCSWRSGGGDWPCRGQAKGQEGCHDGHNVWPGSQVVPALDYVRRSKGKEQVQRHRGVQQ